MATQNYLRIIYFNNTINKPMEIKPVRITRSRQHKQVSPNGLPIVYVGRGSKWGNPFSKDIKKTNKCSCCGHITKATKEEILKSIKFSIERYEDRIKNLIYAKARDTATIGTENEVKGAWNGFELWNYIKEARKFKTFSLEELRGKNLSCWCKQDDPCHADILLDLANNYEFIFIEDSYEFKGEFKKINSL